MILWLLNESHNPGKCHLLSSTNQSEVKIGIETIKSSICVKLPGIKIDNKLKLNVNMEDLCKNASQKILAVARVTSYMTASKTSLVINAFLRSKFNYCP